MTKHTVPFYANTSDDTHCYQAALKMILKYFLPKKEYSWEELEKFTGKKEGLWTWINLGIINMRKLGFDVIQKSDFDRQAFVDEGGDYLKERYGDEVANEQIKHSDIAYEQEVTKEYIQLLGNVPQTTSLDEIKQLLDKGYLIICNVNSQALNNRVGYVGHFVVVFGYDEEQLFLHDPGLPPQENRNVLYEQFKKAWEYPDERSRNIIAFRLQ